MASNVNTSLSLEQLSHGIDRAPLNVYDGAEGHQLITPPAVRDAQSKARSEFSDCETNNSNENVSSGTESNGRNVTKTARLKAGIVAKTTKLLSLHTDQHVSTIAPDLAPPPPTATDDDRLFHSVPEHIYPSVKKIILHPLDTVQSVAHSEGGKHFTKNLDKKDIPHGADVHLVNAYDKIGLMRTERDTMLALQDLKELKKARQNSFVRWTMDRHIRKLQRIPAHMTTQPQRKAYIAKDAHDRSRMQWVKYARDLLLFYSELYGSQYINASSEVPPATEDAINSSIERLILTSMPFQVILMKIRQIYRWEDRIETATYLTIYFFLWTVNYITGFADQVLALLWLTLKRHLSPPTIEDLRETLKRSEDVTKTALDLSQLIEQHGTRGWVDSLIKDLGPMLLLQLEDLTDFLEILRNFYEWRDPDRTKFTLYVLGLSWLTITLTPTWLLVKSTLFVAGVVFFGLFPISSRFPRYRLLASPLRWLFWKIPTDAEWAIARLQIEALHNKETMQNVNTSFDKVTTTPGSNFQRSGEEASTHVRDEGGNSQGTNPSEAMFPGTEIGVYPCTSRKHVGKLHVSFEGVRFETSIRSHEKWNVKYDELKSIEKLASVLPIGAGDDIVFVNMNEEEFKVSGLKLRDEVFTHIVGYSNLRWQTM